MILHLTPLPHTTLGPEQGQIKIFLWRCGPTWTMVSSFLSFLDHAQRSPQLVGLLWTRDQPVAKVSTWQRTTLVRYRHPYPGGIRTCNPIKRAAADLSLIWCGHWYRQDGKLKNRKVCDVFMVTPIYMASLLDPFITIGQPKSHDDAWNCVV
jgi:hypothetical protein